MTNKQMLPVEIVDGFFKCSIRPYSFGELQLLF